MNGMPMTIEEALRRILDVVNGGEDAPGNDVNGIPRDREALIRSIAGALEAGGGSGSGSGFLKVGMEVDMQTDTFTLDKTWQEIHDAIGAGYYVTITNSGDEASSQTKVNETSYGEDVSGIYYFVGVPAYDAELMAETTDSIQFKARAKTDYPVFEMQH